MAEEDQKKKEIQLKFLYIGSDSVFWKKFQERVMTSYYDKKPIFKQFNERGCFSPLKLFYDIYHDNYSVVFLDFSFNEEKLMELAQLLRSETKTKLISTVGIHDRLTKPEIISRALLAGLRLNYYKGEEIDAMIFQVIHYWKPAWAIPPQFSTADIEEPAILIQDLRIVSFDSEAFGIETNSPITDGDIITIRRVLPSKVQKQGFIARGVRDFDLLNNTRFAAQISPMLEPEEEEYISEEEQDQLREEVVGPAPEEEVEEKEKRVITAEEIEQFLQLWTPKNLRVYTPEEYRKVGILVVDNMLEIFTDREFRYKHLPYRINFQGSLHSELFQITRNRPNLIVFSYDPDVNNYNVLKNIVSKVKTAEGYEPHLVIFNSTKVNDELMTFINYDKVLSDGGPLNWDLVKKMAAVLKEKANDPPEGISFVHGNNPGNVLQMERDIKILRVNEKELYLECLSNIPMYTVFRLETPVKMLLTIVPISENHEFNSTPNVYRGLINLVADEHTQRLRVRIKDYLFQEKAELKEQDREEQERKKEEYQLKKEEARKIEEAKKAEETEKAEAQAAEEAKEIVQGDPDQRNTEESE